MRPCLRCTACSSRRLVPTARSHNPNERIHTLTYTETSNYIYIYIYIYSVIQKDGLNFVSLYFKIRTSDKYDMAWTVNGASAHTRRLRYSKFSARSMGWLVWATLKTLLNSSNVLHLYTWSAGAFAFTQTAYLLKLVIPTTNALPRWRLNVEMKTKRALYSSRRLSFN